MPDELLDSIVLLLILNGENNPDGLSALVGDACTANAILLQGRGSSHL